MKRKITHVSEIRKLTDAQFYVVLTFGEIVCDGVVFNKHSEVYFADKALLDKLTIGLEMELDPIGNSIVGNDRISEKLSRELIIAEEERRTRGNIAKNKKAFDIMNRMLADRSNDEKRARKEREEISRKFDEELKKKAKVRKEKNSNILFWVIVVIIALCFFKCKSLFRGSSSIYDYENPRGRY